MDHRHAGTLTHRIQRRDEYKQSHHQSAQSPRRFALLAPRAKNRADQPEQRGQCCKQHRSGKGQQRKLEVDKPQAVKAARNQHDQR